MDVDPAATARGNNDLLGKMPSAFGGAQPGCRHA